MKIRNISGRDLLVPALGGRMVPDGAVIDVEDEGVAAGLLVCVEMWAQVAPDKAK